MTEEDSKTKKAVKRERKQFVKNGKHEALNCAYKY